MAANFLAPAEDAATGSETDKELSDLRSLTSLLDNSKAPLDEIGKVLTTYRDLMANTPTYWPLKGTHGNITTQFGWTTNPFTKIGYMHTGVDIAWGTGNARSWPRLTAR